MTELQILGSLTVGTTHACAPPRDVRGRVVFNLQDLTWCEPAGLVAVAAMASHARRNQAPVRVSGPHTPDAANYLARMHLGLVLDDLGATHDLPRVRERPLAGSLAELVMFRTYEECDAAAASVRETAATKCGEEVASALYEALIEAVQNVVDHSRTGHGFVAAQAFPTKRIVQFAVADAGIGLRRSLAARGASNDEAAINLALRGVSSSDDQGRGRGFPTMRDLTERTGGSLAIVSGAAWSVGRRVVSLPRSFGGTVIQGTLGYAA